MIKTSCEQLINTIGHINNLDTNTILKTNKESKLEVIGNTPYGIKVHIKTDIPVDGNLYFSVNTKHFLQVLKRVKKKDVTLELKDNQLRIDNRFSLPIMKEFIQIKVGKPENLFSIHAGDWYDLLNKTQFIIPVESYNESLTNLLFKFEENNLTVTASDGFCLAYTKKEIQGTDGEYLVPVQSIISLKNIIRKLEPDKEIKVGFNSTSFMIRVDNIFFVSPLSNQKFPVFKTVLKDVLDANLYPINREQLHHCVTDILSVLNESEIIRFRKGLVLETTPENKSGQAKAELEFDEDFGEFCINGRRLDSVLRAMKNETIYISRVGNFIILKEEDIYYILLEMQA